MGKLRTSGPAARRVGAFIGLILLMFSGALAQTVRPGLAQPLAVRWRYASDQTVNLTPAVEGERVYVPLAGGA